ncbi:MAG: DUF1501 domain-containing protein [Pirellulaceae bacterium]
MNPSPLQTTFQGRRALLQRAGFGMGAFALSHLLCNENHAAERSSIQTSASEVARAGMHHAAKAKSIIYIHMVGAPSHLDLYDLKPELQNRSGEDCPKELFESSKFAFVRDLPTLLGTPKEKKFAFTPCGQSGLQLSNLLPHLQSVADELTLIKTLHTDEFNHGPGADVHAQWFWSVRQAEFGIVAQLWIGK